MDFLLANNILVGDGWSKKSKSGKIAFPLRFISSQTNNSQKERKKKKKKKHKSVR